MNEDNAKIKIYYDELRNLYELRKNATDASEIKKIDEQIANFKLNINVLRMRSLYPGCVAAICVAPDGFIGTSVAVKGKEAEFSHVKGFIQAALALGIDLQDKQGMSVYELGELITSYNGVVYQTMNDYVIAYLPSNLTQEQYLAASSVLTKFKDCMISTLQNGDTQDCIDFDTVQEILKQSLEEPKKLSR